MQHVVRHFLEAARHLPANAERPLDRLAHIDLAAHAREVLVDRAVASVQAGAEQPGSAFRQYGGQQAEHAFELPGFCAVQDLALRVVSPCVAQQVVDVGDGDAPVGQLLSFLIQLST